MSEAKPDPRLDRVMALANWKGGVGKTTLTANMGHTLANGGARILLVDLDLSGNLALDLGLIQHPEQDAGAGLMAAIRDGEALHPIKGVRPGLDWIPGGMELRGIGRLDPEVAIANFREQIAAAAQAGDYDLVMLDCPPNHPEIIEMAFGAARYILVPSKSDPASWDGIAKLGPFVHQARSSNPKLTWLGIVIFDVDTQATSVLASVRSSLSHYGMPILTSPVRHSARGAHFTRARGQLLGEFANGSKDTIRALRMRRSDPTVEIPVSGGETAKSLQEDYEHIAGEVIQLITQHEDRQATV